MQTQYARTQTNQKAILHSLNRSAHDIDFPIGCFFCVCFSPLVILWPITLLRLPPIEYEHQLSACTFWLWLTSLGAPADTASVFCILESSLAGESDPGSCWILGSAGRSSYQNEQWASCPAHSPNTSPQRGSLASPMWCGLGGRPLDDLWDRWFCLTCQ